MKPCRYCPEGVTDCQCGRVPALRDIAPSVVLFRSCGHCGAILGAGPCRRCQPPPPAAPELCEHRQAGYCRECTRGLL